MKSDAEHENKFSAASPNIVADRQPVESSISTSILGLAREGLRLGRHKFTEA